MRGSPADAHTRRELPSPSASGAQACNGEPEPITPAPRSGARRIYPQAIVVPHWQLASEPASRFGACLPVLTPPYYLQHLHYPSKVRLVSALLRFQTRATPREALWEGTTMRKTLIMGVLSIGILTFVSINTYADTGTGDYKAHSDEKALDLSKPENIARLTGTWEGTWKNLKTGGNGQILQKYAFDPKDEERPVMTQTKRRPAGILGGPDKWGSGRATIEGGKVVARGTRYNTTLTLYEHPDGTLVLRGYSEGFGETQGAEIVSELTKLTEGQAYKHFPPDKAGTSARAAE
jgi:hypothetical protein